MITSVTRNLRMGWGDFVIKWTFKLQSPGFSVNEK